MKKRTYLLWGLILLSFASIEFPGIFLINRIEPRILGLPFIYGFTLIVWFFLCILMLIGYRMKWGYQNKSKNKPGDPETESKSTNKNNKTA